MDKKNLFIKGYNRCLYFKKFIKNNVSFDKFKEMSCIDKNGKCINPIIRSNCKVVSDNIKQMIKDNKNPIEIKNFINKNVF